MSLHSVHITISTGLFGHSFKVSPLRKDFSGLNLKSILHSVFICKVPSERLLKCFVWPFLKSWDQEVSVLLLNWQVLLLTLMSWGRGECNNHSLSSLVSSCLLSMYIYINPGKNRICYQTFNILPPMLISIWNTTRWGWVGMVIWLNADSVWLSFPTETEIGKITG